MTQYKITWKYTVYDAGTKVFHNFIWSDSRNSAVRKLRKIQVGPIDVLRIKEMADVAHQ